MIHERASAIGGLHRGATTQATTCRTAIVDIEVSSTLWWAVVDVPS